MSVVGTNGQGNGAKTGKKHVILVVSAATVLMIPIILIAMLPILIFGPLFSDGSSSKNGISDPSALSSNIAEMNTTISQVLSEELAATQARIDDDFRTSGCDQKEIRSSDSPNAFFNANSLLSLYCASTNEDVSGISVADMESVIRNHSTGLYSFTYTDEEREVIDETAPPADPPQHKTIKVRVYTIVYNGEAYFENSVFALTPEQECLAEQYAQNLSALLNDGVYQSLSPDDYLLSPVNYAGVVFTDGATPVEYYNQLDERWKNLPYGTDNIGGYGCGPTSMAIVVSSLTSETVDPPHMAQWSYEHGHWCSKSGSYRSLITYAAKAWGLNVENCSATEVQRIVDALSSGKLVVAIMGKGHFTANGHFMVLRGITADGRVLVADPASYSRSSQTWDIKLVLGEVSKVACEYGPLWIISK